MDFAISGMYCGNPVKNRLIREKTDTCLSAEKKAGPPRQKRAFLRQAGVFCFSNLAKRGFIAYNKSQRRSKGALGSESDKSIEEKTTVHGQRSVQPEEKGSGHGKKVYWD